MKKGTNKETVPQLITTVRKVRKMEYTLFWRSVCCRNGLLKRTVRGEMLPCSDPLGLVKG